MLCENKEDRDKCAADGIFQKFDPTITFFCEFCDYFWFSKLQGASSPPFAVGRPWPCTHISHTTKVYTPTSTFAMSHFTVWKKSGSDFTELSCWPLFYHISSIWVCVHQRCPLGFRTKIFHKLIKLVYTIEWPE